MNEQKYDLFLNYSRSDIETVQMLASELSDCGIHVWLDQWELVPGQDWSKAREQAMQQSRATGICIGPKKSGRLDEQAQEARVLVQQHNQPGVVIAILLPDSNPANIPETLKNEVYIDFREGTNSHHAIS